MARYPYQNTTKDGSGKVITSATVAVFLTGTSTPASIYAASAGGVAVNSVTSGTDTSSSPGYFIFWVDRGDYSADQEFDITISKSGFNTQTYPFVVIDNAADYPLLAGRTVGQTLYLTDLITEGPWVDVRAHGASSSYTAAVNTPAIQAALITQRLVVFPAGTYAVNANINIPASTYLLALGEVWITTNQATGNVFTITGANVTIDGLRFTSSVARTADCYIYSNQSYTTIRNFYMDKYFWGIKLFGGAIDCIENGNIRDGVVAATSAGIILNGAVNDVFIDKIVMYAEAALQPGSGIWITYAAAVNITDCDIIRHTNNLLINPTTGEGVTTVRVINSYFDSCSGHGIEILPSGTADVTRLTFDNCWTGNATLNGILMQETGTGHISGVDFNGHQSFLNAGNGAEIVSGDNIKFNGGIYAENTGNGITIGANVSNFSIIGVKSGSATAFSGGNGNYGIAIAAGASDHYIIQGNDLIGNTAGSLSDGGTGSDKILKSNIGYNPVGNAAPALPASTVAYTNAYGQDCMVTVYGGTVTVIAVSGTTTGLTSGTFIVPAGGTITITYSAAPTWTWNRN